MKQTITNYELGLVDKLALQSDLLRQQRLAIVSTMCDVLVVAPHDPGHCKVEAYVLAGGARPIEELLAHLGITVANPLPFTEP